VNMKKPDKKQTALPDLELREGQSLELLKALHILTREGKINQDSRRKLKQVNHLLQFIGPLLQSALAQNGGVCLVDHGAGKSYLGFMLYDAFLKKPDLQGQVVGIESRAELVERSHALAQQLGFKGMAFHHLTVAQALESEEIPAAVDIVTALHACNTATDDAIEFGLRRQCAAFVLVPCCQAEVAAQLRAGKNNMRATSSLTELWRHPLHTREFGSQVTNVLRCLRLEASGYEVTVTELVGWEHSMKNELIIAKKTPSAAGKKATQAAQKLNELLQSLGLEAMAPRFAPAN